MPAHDTNKDIDAYLAGIRKTISDSNALVSQAELRLAETDRLLASQGLTREQVLAMQFSDEQVRAANEELKRRGMAPLDNEAISLLTQPSANPPARPFADSPAPRADASHDAELENRQRKFGMMMKPFQI